MNCGTIYEIKSNEQFLLVKQDETDIKSQSVIKEELIIEPDEPVDTEQLHKSSG